MIRVALMMTPRLKKSAVSRARKEGRTFGDLVRLAVECHINSAKNEPAVRKLDLPSSERNASN